MLVVVLSADIGFVHLDDAAKLFFGSIKRSADFVAHAKRFRRAKAHVALNLRQLIPFLLVSIRWATLNQSRSGLLVFSKMVPAMTRTDSR